MTQPTLTFYYDGLCQLCSREVALFRRRTQGDPSVIYLDIADPSFDAAAHGLDAERIHQTMHVKVGDEVRTGLDAFLAVWPRVPGFAWLARLASLPLLRPFFRIGYAVFARVRPWLPRRKADCADGTCRR